VKISGKSNQTILENKAIEESVKISDCEKCTIVNCDFSNNDSGVDMFVLDNCKECKVIKSKFHDKSTVGCAVKVDGEKTRDNLFEECEWHDLSYNEGNGGEPLRIGNSRRSHLFFNTIVRNCTFRNLNADVETISIKSCGNKVEKCEQKNCKSSFVIRHGHTNTIQDNEFIGEEGGIRVYGKDNKILRNRFNGNKSKKFPPLTLVNGNTKDEPNQGALGSSRSHAAYTQVRNNEISGNTFDNCRTCVVWGRDLRTHKPQDVKFKNNKVIADRVECTVIKFSGGAKPEGNEFAVNEVVGTKARIDRRITGAFTGVQTQPIEPAESEEEEEEPEDQLPPIPDPVMEPQIDTEPLARLCTVCGDQEEGNEAKVKLSIHLCPEHTTAAKEALKRLLTELRAIHS
jgi:hypothetical protein